MKGGRLSVVESADWKCSLMNNTPVICSNARESAPSSHAKPAIPIQQSIFRKLQSTSILREKFETAEIKRNEDATSTQKPNQPLGTEGWATGTSSRNPEEILRNKYFRQRNSQNGIRGIYILEIVDVTIDKKPNAISC
ncbi:unnamed protein product [Allacma fusca]|uniref:Uncharacterized protein n=1 Tax=Allacma fusca TaxID=39272 RepID=A0A8J2PMB8_9HEXA|nr:unnamed protein product [Allacma fusca]